MNNYYLNLDFIQNKLLFLLIYIFIIIHNKSILYVINFLLI